MRKNFALTSTEREKNNGLNSIREKSAESAVGVKRNTWQPIS